MNRMELEALTERWLRCVCEGEPFDPLLGPALDAATFATRAAGARAKLGSPLVGTVDEVVCENTRVAWRWTLRGPRGELRGVNFQQVANGRVVAHWTIAG